ncbi:coiled-coil domain-containing protein 157 isoform X1 [Gallus gallus]|uniref:coiled-coil domain-containing protein 157 isoform X1 n=2 Tax=Gallus gallus TaxID=9031 RepID=UPI001AE70761|nr:coiled-coil domain-containing protein 157 isoform X1 [Gallus gallus]
MAAGAALRPRPSRQPYSLTRPRWAPLGYPAPSVPPPLLLALRSSLQRLYIHLSVHLSVHPASSCSMAHLLGHPGCMASLQADLKDLQGAIADVTSRTGPARFPSWKFPNKVSCELDLEALLERYSHAEGDPEFSQHAHVVLLELVIDRLLLLLQSFTGYAENLLSERAVPPAEAVGPCMSAGLTVRRYWHSMLRLGACYQQLQTEKKSCRKDIAALQSTPEAERTAKECLKDCLPSTSEPSTPPGAAQPSSPWQAASNTSGSSQPRPACSTAERSHSIPIQAAEPPAPCDTCASAQAGLQEISKAITSICQSQNIPSALSRFQELVEGTEGRRTLSATDVSYWVSEQSKNLSCISKQLHSLLEQVNSLKSELAESKKEKDELRKQVKDFARLLQAEKEIQAQQRKEAEQSLEVKNKERLEAVARLEQDKNDLRRGAALLEEQISALKEALATKQAAVQELEATKQTLLEDLKAVMVAKSRVLELEEEVQLLTSQRDSLGQELSEVTTQLEKEKAKVESTLRHEKSLQAKQSTLLQQLDSLDQEREELQASLGEVEEDRARMAEQLQESQKQKEQSMHQLRVQQELLDTLQQEKLSLEQSVSKLQENVSRLEEQAKDLKEREKLLVFFPELHIPIETQFESTGNITEDMEKQLQANHIRIGVLEQENMRLRAALAKVKAAAQQGVLQHIPQTQLWTQLSSQRGGETAGPPSLQGSGDGTGSHRATSKARQRPVGSKQHKLLPAEPAREARPCITLPAEGLALAPHKPRGSSSAARAHHFLHRK